MRTHRTVGRRTPRAVIASILLGLAAAGCNSDSGQGQPPQGTQLAVAPDAVAQNGAAQAGGGATPAPETAAPPVPAAAVTQASWAPDALEELLAPIALYPDALLGQVLAASVNSQEVLDGGNWLLENESVKGSDIDAAAEKVGFGPAMRALLQFPTVVDMMCQQIDWTRQIGSAFSSDQKGVLDAVQRLRKQAADVGNLKTTPQQTVETKTENDKVIVEVKPADPMVVYVPQYDPTVIYSTPPPPPPPPAAAPTTTVVQQDTVSKDSAIAGGLLAFGAGMLLAHAIDDNNYYCYPHWGFGSVYMGPRPFYPPAYVYRPVYGPAFRPAYGYRPPPSYRYNYKSGNNIVINNNNYYNRFSNNQNLKVNNVNSPLGRSTYAGARNDATAARLNQAAGGVNRPGADNRLGAGNAGERAQPGNLGANRPQGGNVGANRAEAGNLQNRAADANRTQHVDRGYGASTRTAPRDLGAVQRPTPAAPPPPRPASNAFAGAASRDNGSFERAASARGHASAGSHPAHAAGGNLRRR